MLPEHRSIVSLGSLFPCLSSIKQVVQDAIQATFWGLLQLSRVVMSQLCWAGDATCALHRQESLHAADLQVAPSQVTQCLALTCL